MSALLSDPRMSERERACAESWLAAALQDDNAEQTAYWRERMMAARTARLMAGGEPIPEPPVREPVTRKKKEPKTCPECGAPEHDTPFACLL